MNSLYFFFFFIVNESKKINNEIPKAQWKNASSQFSSIIPGRYESHDFHTYALMNVTDQCEIVKLLTRMGAHANCTNRKKKK